ncbi:uncharacterized protein T069G_10685 [Trichoderma breve]|uniref:Secreted protein n=1 Tax=Trichoderma breve TaxID=2034170 RepID=A0A9W9E3G9_9HYPO|nr:uncharacterized protein T069G_10685 [Trichoderma breve]KAJ4855127.1 hypothetical protein T069G_10685 [Trichoderma breve]
MHFLATVASLASIAMAASATGPACSATTSNVQLANKIVAEAATDIDAALSLAAGFKCPAPMAYSPWTKACSCLPGQSFDGKTCSGTALVGAWPMPKCSASGSTVALSAFCAISPVKFTKYDATHAWCQATVETFTFCAEAEIEAEISALGLGINLDVELDISLTSKISATLRATSAALAGFFVETLAEAVVIFNTNAFGLVAVAADVEASLTTGLFAQLKATACLLGLGTCQFDCVSFSTKGCHNYIDVVGALGGRISGLVGVTILSDTILSVSSTKVVSTLHVQDMLCTSTKLNTPLVSEYKFTC